MKSIKEFVSKSNELTKEESIAYELARALNDMKGYNYYLSCVQKYPEVRLRKILGEVKKIPDDKIKKSRGALFNYLLRKS